MNTSEQTRRSSGLEKLAWLLGCALLLSYGAVRWHLHESSSTDVRAFEDAKRDLLAAPTGLIERSPSDAGKDDGAVKGVPDDSPPFSESLSLPGQPNMTTWSSQRRAAYVAERAALPAGVLRIESLDLVVPIYRGTSEQNLNRGIAWIEHTAPLGTLGNVGLAAHRDGYFRALSGIETGDRVMLETLRGSFEYIVDQTMIVDPTAVEVLAPSAEGRLTLVTCYPFYFVGPAPQRFIVHARVATEQSAAAVAAAARSLTLASTSAAGASAPQLAP